MTINENPTLHHICEVCDLDEVMTSKEASAAGWDYPPNIGRYGFISPRICPSCPMTSTVWWALTVDHCTVDTLTDHQRRVVARIQGEPASIAADVDD